MFFCPFVHPSIFLSIRSCPVYDVIAYEMILIQINLVYMFILFLTESLWSLLGVGDLVDKLLLIKQNIFFKESSISNIFFINIYTIHHVIRHHYM